MRITRILPSLFGKFTTPKPLDIPDNSLVVIFGENETGKSTFADMAVTLLSDKYETEITNRFGSVRSPLRGQIVLAEDESTLVVEFANDAEVPGNRSNVRRKPSDTRSPIWRKIVSLDSNIIKNLFRLNATEIQNGEQTKTKFENYGLGDRRGASIASVINGYREGLRQLERSIGESEITLSSKRADLSRAQQTGSQYQLLLSDIAHAREAETSLKDELTEVQETLGALAVRSTIEPTIEVAREAEINLRTAQDNGAIVPLDFASVHTSIQGTSDEFEKTELSARESEFNRLSHELESEKTRVNEELLKLGLDRDRLLASVTLADQHSRNELLADLQRKTIYRSTLRQKAEDLRQKNNEVEVEYAKSQAESATEAWQNTGVTVTALEYIARPSFLDIAPAQPSPAGNSNRQWVLAGIAAVGAVICLAAYQRFGAVASVVVGAVGFLMLRPRAPQIMEKTDITSEPVDPDLMLELAKRVVESKRVLDQTKLDLAKVRDTLPVVAQEIMTLDDEIKNSLQSVGLAVDKAISPVGLNSLFGTIAELVSAAHNLDSHERKVAEALQSLDNARRAFDKLKDKLVSDFAAAGVEISHARVTSPIDAVNIISDWCDRWDKQSAWRMAIGTLNDQIDANPKLADRVRELLSMSAEDLAQVDQDTKSDKLRIDSEIEDLRRRITNWENAANTLSTDARIVEINALIETLQAQIREDRIESMRMRTQISLAESLAKKRAEESKPELVRRVQEMVLSVAEDWKAIEFDETGKVITVERQSGELVADSALSAGARSLLYTAMRVAIMQQESDGENGFRIPLFCDDPLLHLDDRRTKQAFQMLRDQSAGHQIIYFTCKNEIRELAVGLGVPVVTIG